MSELFAGSIPIIDTDSPAGRDALFAHPGATFGCVPRDYAVDPEIMRAPPSQMSQIPESEWDARFDEQTQLKSSLEHIYLSGPNGEPAFINLDQSKDGDCWSYSTVHAMMLDRLKRNLPMRRLNPHAVAAMCGRPGTGGWCGLSGQFARQHGVPEEGTGPGQWPKWSHDLRHDTPALREAMARYKVTEDWYDVARSVWDQRMNRGHLATCGFENVPCPSDFPWWGHSVCQLRWVRIERNSWGPLILNSWKDWGRHGLAVLRGSQATAGNAIGVRVTTAS